MSNLKELKTELYNIAKPLRYSNCHAASALLIQNEIIVLRSLEQTQERDNKILRWKWALSACKAIQREIESLAE